MAALTSVRFMVGKLSPETNRCSALFMTCMLQCLGVTCTAKKQKKKKTNSRMEKEMVK